MAARSHDTARDPRWARIVARDATADGLFWYSVATTGVYCRPSCPSRPKRPENVAIHETIAAARATGARACRRCRPDASDPGAGRAAMIARACRIIETAEQPPRLAELARAVGLSPGHLQRVFTAATGLSPRGYADARRAERTRAALAAAPTVTEALYAGGFGSSARFYDHAPAMLGMTPRRYRSGAPAERIRFAIGESSLGAILVASSGLGVAAILLGDDPDALLAELRGRFPHADLIGADAAYEALVARVVGLVEAPAIGLDLPLDIRGTAFQGRVWAALRAIPAGRTASYAGIAAAIGAPGSVRAVANACAANAHAVAIPCHRVVRSDGSPSGYRWGPARKRALIAREAPPR